MKLGIASDHRGYETKKELFNNLKNKYEIIDYGNLFMDDNDDYPLFAIKLGEAVFNKKIDLGIILCGTGIGASIAANKVKSVRCAKVDSLEDARLSREDNNANIIAINPNNNMEELIKIIEKFINTEYKYIERHQRRIDIISSYENK